VDDDYFEAIRGAARRQLAETTGQKPRSALLRRNGSPNARDPNSWHNACLAWGLVAAYRTFRDEPDREAVLRFLEDLIDSDGAFRRPLTQVDQCMIGYPWIDAFEDSGHERHRKAIDRLARFLLDDHVRTASGTLPYTDRVPSLVLVDTLAMVCPFLARYGNCFGVSEATDLAIAQLDEFLDHGLHEKSGLPFHGFAVGGADDLGVIGWARGTGWLAMALADTLTSLPPDHAARPRLAEAMGDLAGAVKAFQLDDGVWRWAITVPDGPVDTSGTAMIGYAIERAVASGALDASWTNVSEKALTAIVRNTRDDGRVDRANGECLGVGLHPFKNGPAPWAQGPAVALTALVRDRRQAAVEKCDS